MNELVGIQKAEEEQPIQKRKPEEPIETNPVVSQESNLETNPQTNSESNPVEPIPVPVPPTNPIFPVLQASPPTEEEILRIEKIESNPDTDEMELLYSVEPPNEHVVFRIYSPYYEIYETLFTDDYLKSIGFTTEPGGMSGGGEQDATFPYNLFKAIFSNTFGRLGYMFQPKKESLAEETLKQSDNLLASVGQFKTEELLKSTKEEFPETTQTETIEPESNSNDIPPYFEIKIPKSGPVLSQQEYNEQKLRETNDEILEHDEHGKTFQEILLETRQDEIQQERKQILLSILDVPLNQTGNDSRGGILEKIKMLENMPLKVASTVRHPEGDVLKKDESNEKVWFIRQQVVLDDDDSESLRQPTYKWIKLNLSLL